MPTADYLRHKAAFSDFATRNVDPNAPQNLATRSRRQRALQDMDAAAEAQVEEEANAAKRLMLRDTKAQSLYFGQQRLQMQREMHDARLRAAEEKMQAEAEILPLRKNALIAQERGAVALERARTQAADFKARMDQQEHDDTAGFTGFIVNSGARRGTPEFANTVAEARIKFPAVPTALFDDTWKMTGSTRTPEEVQASIAAARAANPNATITATEKGTTIVDRPTATKVLDPELATLQEQLKQGEADQAKVGAAERPVMEPRLRTLRERIAAHQSKGTTETPATSQRPVFKDKFGNKAYRNTDGSFEAIQ